MRRALVLQHMNQDHPGRFLDFFAETGFVPAFVRLWAGEEVPALGGYDLMFVLGGDQHTWQEAEYPWLVMEKQAIREWVRDRAKPYFGVCLGHQLLCAALGGEVALAERSEVGVCDVALTEDGLSHPLMAGIAPAQKVMQYHEAEVTRLPNDAVVLATGESTPVQAVAIGTHAIGTQFHCEQSPQSLAAWAWQPDLVAYLQANLGADAHARLVADSYPWMPSMAATARRLFGNLVGEAG